MFVYSILIFVFFSIHVILILLYLDLFLLLVLILIYKILMLFYVNYFIYVSFLFSTLLPTILILASIDRLLISSQNVDTRLYSSKRLAYFSISISTFFWIVFNFHILIKVNIQELYPSVFYLLL